MSPKVPNCIVEAHATRMPCYSPVREHKKLKLELWEASATRQVSKWPLRYCGGLSHTHDIPFQPRKCHNESGTVIRPCVSTCLCICLCVCLILCVWLHGCGIDGLHLFVHVYLLCVCLIVCEVDRFVCLCLRVCVHPC